MANLKLLLFVFLLIRLLPWIDCSIRPRNKRLASEIIPAIVSPYCVHPRTARSLCNCCREIKLIVSLGVHFKWTVIFLPELPFTGLIWTINQVLQTLDVCLSTTKRPRGGLAWNVSWCGGGCKKQRGRISLVTLQIYHVILMSGNYSGHDECHNMNMRVILCKFWLMKGFLFALVNIFCPNLPRTLSA